MSGTLPVVLTKDGLQPQSPTTINTQIIANAQSLSPGLTILPSGLIEDMSSTATGAVVVIDQVRVDYVNSLTPYGANAFVLNQLGQIYGVPLGIGSNTSVNVVFSGPAGFVIAKGFTVSDGTFQYFVQDGGVISTSGTTQPLSAVATQSGTWAVPANTVTQLVTSVPSAITLTVTNPISGTPGSSGQTEDDYRSQVFQAGLVASQGQATYLKTLLNQVQGVQNRLVSVRQQLGGGWEVLVGGAGDPFEIAYAIYSAMDISILVGSVMTITNITNANPAVITTALNHGYSNAQVVVVNAATGLTALNGLSLAATVISQTSFSVPFNTTGSGNYTGNGFLTPNFRNVSINLFDFPDTYSVPFVVPPSQTVAMTVTWNTSSPQFVSVASVANAAQPALATYVNTLPVGQPMNLFELQATFQTAIAPILPPALLTRMIFSVTINGVVVTPSSGTGIIAGDPESFFVTTAPSIVVNQG